MLNNKNIYFDWTRCTEKDLEENNAHIGDYEDNIVGFLYLDYYGQKFYIDIHYEYFDSKDHGFDIEVYTQNEDGTHGKWYGSIKSIKSATSYIRFCHRVEDVMTTFLVN